MFSNSQGRVAKLDGSGYARKAWHKNQANTFVRKKAMK